MKVNVTAAKLFFKALGNQDRFKILNFLIDGKKTVNEIVLALKKDQANVSHDLRCLLNCRFVKKRRAGKNCLYELNPETKRLLEKINENILKYENFLTECGAFRRKEKWKNLSTL